VDLGSIYANKESEQHHYAAWCHIIDAVNLKAIKDDSIDTLYRSDKGTPSALVPQHRMKS
jgi:hypothetical protein